MIRTYETGRCKDALLGLEPAGRVRHRSEGKERGGREGRVKKRKKASARCAVRGEGRGVGRSGEGWGLGCVGPSGVGRVLVCWERVISPTRSTVLNGRQVLVPQRERRHQQRRRASAPGSQTTSRQQAKRDKAGPKSRPDDDSSLPVPRRGHLPCEPNRTTGPAATRAKGSTVHPSSRACRPTAFASFAPNQGRRT